MQVWYSRGESLCFAGLPVGRRTNHSGRSRSVSSYARLQSSRATTRIPRSFAAFAKSPKRSPSPSDSLRWCPGTFVGIEGRRAARAHQHRIHLQAAPILQPLRDVQTPVVQFLKIDLAATPHRLVPWLPGPDDGRRGCKQGQGTAANQKVASRKLHASAIVGSSLHLSWCETAWMCCSCAAACTLSCENLLRNG